VTPYSTLAALNVDSCDCTPILFEGTIAHQQEYTIISSSSSLLSGSCISDECVNASLLSISRVCPESFFRIFSTFSTVTMTLNNSLYCMSVSFSEVTADTLAVVVTKSFSISFVKPKTSGVLNSLSIVENSHGVIVGQLISNLLVIEYNFPSLSGTDEAIVMVSICLEEDSTIQVDGKFSVTDLGYQKNGDGTVYPFGFSGETKDILVCFPSVQLEEQITSFVLIKRYEEYENNQLITPSQSAILFTTASLYLLGLFVILYVIVLCASVHALQMETVLLWSQCFSLFSFRCVYFFLVAYYVLSPGSLLDYVLIETPTFFYVGILLQLLIPIAHYHRHRKLQKSKNQMRFFILAGLIVIWISFGAIVIALSQINITTTESYECSCRISSQQEPSNAVQIIRITYKSLVFAFSLCVVGLLWIFTRDLLYDEQPHLFLQIMGIAFCLSFNCLAFVIYYAIGQTTPYFAIVLWFTELIPILCLSMVVGAPVSQIGRYTCTLFHLVLMTCRCRTGI
jgi:hypothetical protein